MTWARNDRLYTEYPNLAMRKEDTAVVLARLDLALCHGDNGLLNCLLDVCTMLDRIEAPEQLENPNTTESPRFPLQSTQARSSLLTPMTDAVATLSVHQKAELFNMLVDDEKQHMTADGKLFLIRASILSEYPSSMGDSEIAALRPALSHTCTFLSFCLERSQDFQQKILSSQCICAFLQRHPRFVTQWHVEQLLAAIANVSQQVEDVIVEKRSAMIYTALCRLFITVLRIHRAKIGGRYHLIVPAVQGLLRCLFTPYPASDTDLEPESAFTVQQAADYTRVLTMLCDPTVTSVTYWKKRSRNGLNDETKKARSIAGQYLHYLIMEYCQCQLKGKLPPDMRSALNPGLWAVLEVMSKELMRSMNAQMDASSRSVFKALYDDFKRFGKWTGD